ncbi:MAG: hypothetical protein MK200_04710 [Nitrosopumilus sp.]|nr:hypothetical protein [Nitrosopumilus sp.]
MTRENLKKILREYGVHKYCSDWEALIESLMSEYEEAYSEGYDYAKNEESLVNDAVEALSE